MTTPLLVALLLGAAQSTGTMSPTSDVSSNRVKATGASESRALRDHLRTLPDTCITATGGTTCRSPAARAGDVANVKDFGALGNYVPATGVGADDTSAIQNALNSGSKTVFLPTGIYKVTAMLTVPNGVTVFGSGLRSSLLWGALPNASTDLLNLGPAGSTGRAITLREFGIVGGTSPGRAAITGWAISNSVMDVYVNGGWEYQLYIFRTYASGEGWDPAKVVYSTQYGDGVTTRFDPPYKFDDPSAIWVTIAAGESDPMNLWSTQVYDVDYTVTGGNTGSGPALGTVTFVSPPNLGYTVRVRMDGGTSSGIDCLTGETLCGGGFEGNHVRLHHTNFDSSLPFAPALAPNPKRGIFVRGWINGSEIWANIGTLTVGDGVRLEGTYGSANNGKISGLFQGIAGWGLYATGSGTLLNVSDAHYEVNGGDVYVSGHSKITIGPSVVGQVTLRNTTYAKIQQHSGRVDIDATNQNAFLESGADDASMAVTNSSPTTTAIGYMPTYTVGGGRSPSALPAPISETNLIANGDFARFLSTTDGANESIWGVSGYYAATRTGIGLSDTTHTNGSPYAAKIGQHVAWGRSAYFPIFAAGELPAAFVGLPITVSFKWKLATGDGWLGVIERTTTNIAESYGVRASDGSVVADNGFQSYALSFLLTAEQITNGAGLQLTSVPTTPGVNDPEFYISEVQAVMGASAPRAFNRLTRDRSGQVEIRPGGTLLVPGTDAPASGGDPVFSKDWRPGDAVWNTAPAAGGPPCWVNITAGSPGTWKACANLAP